jgi:hypothetical protein
LKIGDKVYSKKVRPNEVATIIKVRKDIRDKATDKGIKKEFRTSYVAQFEDQSTLIFYGFDINRFIFKVDDDHGQMNLADFMDMSTKQTGGEKDG